MPKVHQVILIHPDAATKPAPGAPCNGCGVCCLLEPCPLGMVLSRRRQGACVAVRWDDEGRQYRCGAVVIPGLAWLAKRWIAVGQGCDSTVEPGVLTQRLPGLADSPTIKPDPDVEPTQSSPLN